MLNQKGDAITLPQPVKCHCGKGYLLPILQPVNVRVTTFNMGLVDTWGEKYQVTWECSACHIQVRGGIK